MRTIGRSHGGLIGGLLSAILLCGTSALATTYTWTGGSGNWSGSGNWDQPGTPGAGSDVVINQAGANVLLDSATTVQSLVVGGTATLTFTNWTTKLTVSGDVTVQSGGKITLPPAFTPSDMSNRVWIACNNLTVDAGGSIDANGKGFAAKPAADASTIGYGPGAGYATSGASHGGLGGMADRTKSEAGPLYDSASDPTLPGSSSGGVYGWAGSAGGGVIRIEATGDMTVNGPVTANGADNYLEAGSGGSIYISCNRILGTGSGSISAVGGVGTAGATYGYGYCSGGGGRIAVIYNSGNQAAVSPVPTITFDAGKGSSPLPVSFGDVGTLYFPDTYFLSTTISSLSGQFMAPNFTNWSVESLLISNSWIRFPASNFRLTVTGDLTIIGSGNVPSAGLGLGGDQFFTDADVPYSSGPGPQLRVEGNLTLTNGSLLSVYPAATNSGPIDYGASVTVGGELAVATNCWIYPYSHPIDGGSVRFSVGSLRLDNGGAIDVSGKGYPLSWAASAWGYGPGAGYYTAAGGYGGTGGYPFGSTGPVYGDSNAPVRCGSSGGPAGDGLRPSAGGSASGAGGGVAWVFANETITVNGTITANGKPANVYSGAGSGGSIYLRCRVLQGSSTGMLVANGGEGAGGPNDYSMGGAGGGGRIAVWRVSESPSGLQNVIASSANPGGGNPTGCSTCPPKNVPTAGTIVWGWVPPQGTIVTLR